MTKLISCTAISAIYSHEGKAIKFLHDEEFDFLETSYLASKRANSPYIIKVFDCKKFEINGKIKKGLVTELYDTNFHEVLKEYSFKECLQIFYDACRGVRDLHEKNICHNDIKPGNIFVKDKRGYVGDLDSCLADHVEDKVENVHFTTYAYAAPEVYSEKDKEVGYYSAPGDVWSLGCILYQLLTNSYLFYSTYEDHINFFKDKEDMSDHISYYLAHKDEKKREMAKLLQKMWIIDPNKRVKISEVVENPLFKDCL